MAQLRILSLNCHGFNIGIESYLARICENIDIILLQETWLSDFTYDRITAGPLSAYCMVHTSAMEDKLQNGILHGRPFGGTAVLYKRSLGLNVSLVYTGSPRCTALKIHQDSDVDIIIASIYMPYDARNIDSEIDFESTLGQLQGIIASNVGCKFIFGGDFNVSKDANSSHLALLHSFCLSNDLKWLDHTKDINVNYTYHVDKNNHFSLIDHFLCSSQLFSDETFIDILPDGDNPSDHFAIACSFKVRIPDIISSSKPKHNRKLLWDKADLRAYKNNVD